uniref:Uncharacterized protein n=1 Tax=Oryza barthii TaxID=65489 RepID=A0A0D3H6Q4_9ORYZ
MAATETCSEAAAPHRSRRPLARVEPLGRTDNGVHVTGDVRRQLLEVWRSANEAEAVEKKKGGRGAAAVGIIITAAPLLRPPAFRTDSFRRASMLNMLGISAGVTIAAYGETRFDAFGVMLQHAAVAAEATRLVLIHILLTSKGMSRMSVRRYWREQRQGGR